jgi:outer membrane protein
MNRTPTILSGIALLGVIILFILHFSGSRHAKTTTRSTKSSNTTSPATGGARVAYVDIDSFEAHYKSLKEKKAEFAAQQEAMEAELQRSAQQFQADYASLQRKAQAGTLSQAEGEAAGKRLAQMEQTLKTREQAMNTQFKGKLDAFNDELHRQMDAFLEDYTREHNYDYVLSYTRSTPIILYGNEALDITEDVIKGMNERAEKTGNKDSAKSK